MKIFLGIVPLLTVLGLAQPASSFTAENGLEVLATGSRDFTVPYGGLSGPADFWCAAGDYALRELGLRSGAQIYRTSAAPRRAGDGMRFSLDATAAVRSTGLLLIGPKTAGITAGHARSLCDIPLKR
ncbi:MAG: hypothetical protein KDE03_08805 [Rhodobacteraceae bacterium]|nr:hypothetical protein [Paracoccaceae bacterium]